MKNPINIQEQDHGWQMPSATHGKVEFSYMSRLWDHLVVVFLVPLRGNRGDASKQRLSSSQLRFRASAIARCPWPDPGGHAYGHQSAAHEPH